MAAGTLTDLSTILSKLFNHDSISQLNRAAPFFGWLEKKAYSGKAVDWRTAGDGVTVSTFASGAGAPADTFDERKSASLAWARYGATISVADDALAAALGQGTEAAIFSLFEEEIRLASSAIAKAVEDDLFAGDGTSDSLYGTDVAVLDSGAYAGIDQGVDAWWASAAYGTAASEAEMTLDDFGQFSAAIFDTYGAALDGNAGDAWVMDGALYQKFSALVGANPVQYANMGGLDLAAGARSLSYDGVPILRSGGSTALRVYGMRKDECELNYMPVRDSKGAIISNDISVPVGDTGSGAESPLMLHVTPLGRTGAAQRYLCYLQVQLKCRSRFSHGVWRVKPTA